MWALVCQSYLILHITPTPLLNRILKLQGGLQVSYWHSTQLTAQLPPPQIQGLRQIQYLNNKRRFWTAVFGSINNNILLLNKRKKQNKNNSGKSHERKSFLLNGGRWKYSSSAWYVRSAFLQTLGFNGRARILNLKFIIRGIFPLLFISLLSELFFPSIICLLFTSAWIQQEKFKYTSIVCSLTWAFAESFLSSFSSRYWVSITRW